LSIAAITLLLPRHSALVCLNCDPPVDSSVMLRSSAVSPQDLECFCRHCPLPLASQWIIGTYRSVCFVVADYQREFLFIYLFINGDDVANPTPEPATCRTTVPGDSLTTCSVSLPAASLSLAALSYSPASRRSPRIIRSIKGNWRSEDR